MTDAEIHACWDEREAIIEFDAGKSRHDAEKESEKIVERIHGRVPRSIHLAMKQTVQGKTK